LPVFVREDSLDGGRESAVEMIRETGDLNLGVKERKRDGWRVWWIDRKRRSDMYVYSRKTAMRPERDLLESFSICMTCVSIAPCLQFLHNVVQ